MKSHSGCVLTFAALTALATTLAVESIHKYYLKDSSLNLLDYVRNLLTASSSPEENEPETLTVHAQSQQTGEGFVRTDENTVKFVGKEYDEDLILEQLTRNYSFLSNEGMAKIRNLRIIVVGAGGVGSNAIVSLARSGVSNMRIIDFDQVSLSSLNRHACATLKDVGRSKVEVLVDFVGQIAPWSNIEGINELFSIEKAERLLLENFKPDYIIDCIDNIDTKIDLLAFCYRNEIPVISSMGAACKSDATRINVGDISVSDEDALARSVRRRLKKLGISNGITTIFSAEKPDPRKASLLPLPEEEFERGKVDELTALQNFRVRILPVLGTMPGMFGLAIATRVITEASGYPVEPVEGKNRYKVYDSLLQSLAGQQTRIGIKDQKTPFVGLSDVQYIIEEIWRGKSPVSGLSTRLTLSRWYPNVELGMQNVVVLTKEEQREHEKRVLIGGEKPEDVYAPEVIERVLSRFTEESYYAKFR